MGRKRAKDGPKRTADRRVWVHFGKIILVLVAAGGGIAAVVWVGHRAGEQVADNPRYAVRFADVRCDPPPGTTRETFLSEVRYLAGLPETVQAVNPDLADQLTPAFRRHPWVADVDAVTVTADRDVEVRLRYRVPVLLVRVRGGVPEERLVDAGGVVLPACPVPDGIAVLVGEQPPPAAAAGQVWEGPVVKRAAELAREFRAVRVEKATTGWRVTERSGRVLSVSG